MNVYVVYNWNSYDGYGAVRAVYKNEEMAKEFCLKYSGYDYDAFELND